MGVSEFLAEGEGLEYFKARLARLTSGAAMTQGSAEQQIFSELVLDAQDLIQRRAFEEFGLQWEEAQQLFRSFCARPARMGKLRCGRPSPPAVSRRASRCNS